MPVTADLGVIFFKDRLKIDDALDVSSVRGVAGIVGALGIGIFASSIISSAGPDGLLFGNSQQLLIQAIGVGVAGLMGFGGTLIIMKVLDILIGVRVSREVEEIGLDMSVFADLSKVSSDLKFRHNAEAIRHNVRLYIWKKSRISEVE